MFELNKSIRGWILVSAMLFSMLLLPLNTANLVLLAGENTAEAENVEPSEEKSNEDRAEAEEAVLADEADKAEEEDLATLTIYKKIWTKPPEVPFYAPRSVNPVKPDLPDSLSFKFAVVPVKDGVKNLAEAVYVNVTVEEPATLKLPYGEYEIFEYIKEENAENGGYSFAEYHEKGEISCLDQYPDCLKGNYNDCAHLAYPPYDGKNYRKKYEACVSMHRRAVLKLEDINDNTKGYEVELNEKKKQLELIVYNLSNISNAPLLSIEVEKKWEAAAGLETELEEKKYEVQLELRKNYFKIVDNKAQEQKDVKVEYFDYTHRYLPKDEEAVKIDPDPLKLNNQNNWKHKYMLDIVQANVFTNYLFYRYDETGREIDYFFKELNIAPGFEFKLKKFKQEKSKWGDRIDYSFTYENYYAGLGQIKVKKELEGSTADPEKVFKFRLSAKKEDLITGPKDEDYLKEFELKGGEEVVISELELGSYTLEELNPDKYEVIYKPGQKIILDENIALNEEKFREITITVINRLPEPTPTPSKTTLPPPSYTSPSLPEVSKVIVQEKAPAIPATGERSIVKVEFFFALALLASSLYLLNKKS